MEENGRCIVILGFQKMRFPRSLLFRRDPKMVVVILSFQKMRFPIIIIIIITAVSPRGSGKRKSSNDDEALAPGS